MSQVYCHWFSKYSGRCHHKNKLKSERTAWCCGGIKYGGLFYQKPENIVSGCKLFASINPPENKKFQEVHLRLKP